jgi:hypothetical protein
LSPGNRQQRRSPEPGAFIIPYPLRIDSGWDRIVPVVMLLSVGTRMGPYEILALVDAGGMGEVYRACDPRMGPELVIKVSTERRFEREVRAVAAPFRVSDLRDCAFRGGPPPCIVSCNSPLRVLREAPVVPAQSRRRRAWPATHRDSLHRGGPGFSRSQDRYQPHQHRGHRRGAIAARFRKPTYGPHRIAFDCAREGIGSVSSRSGTTLNMCRPSRQT